MNLNTKKNTFIWNGINKLGESLSGEIIADNKKTAYKILLADGILCKKIHRKRNAIKVQFKHISQTKITQFTEQLATFLQQQIPLLQALNFIVNNQRTGSFRTMLEAIQSAIQSGNTLQESLLAYPNYFDNLYTTLVQVGESSSTLDSALHHLGMFRKTQKQFKQKLLKAIAYPSFVMFTGIAITAILMLYAIPQYALLFKQFKAPLPGLTQGVLTVASTTQKYWYHIFLTFPGFFIFLTLISKKNNQARILLENLTLKLPIVGNFIQTNILLHISYTFSLTLGARVPLVEALSLIANTTNYTQFKKSIRHIEKEVKEGQALHIAMKRTGMFPATLIENIATGEQTATLATVFKIQSEHYKYTIEQQIGYITTLCEPILMILVGGCVGIIMLAMYLPLFKIGTVF